MSEARPARARSLGLGLALAALLLADPRAALAQDAVRVVLATRDPMLETALRASLAPWHIELIVTDDDAPGASMPASADRGAALATTHHAAAITWISRDESGAFALWIFDTHSGRVIARPLPTGPPFDEPTAASVALSIKTLLRHSAAAPAAERIVDPALPSEARLEIGAGLWVGSTSPSDIEPRFLLGVSGWPRAFDSILGFSLAVRAGTGLGFTTPTLAARLETFDAHVGVRVRGTLAPILDVVVGLELGVTVGWLDATVRSDAVHAAPIAADPSSFLWLEVGLRPISALRLGVRAGVFLTPRTRSYLVRGDAVVETQTAAPFATLFFELPLDGGRVDSP